jgi:hypothetical protein
LKKHDDVSIEKLNKGNAKHGVSPRIKIDPVTLTFDLENQ